MSQRPSAPIRLLLYLPSFLLAGAAILALASNPARRAGSAAEERLLLTPAGLYTRDDIRANGGLPSQRFRDVPIHHEARARPGELICPITLTRANPRIRWSVGGKVYHFCCPPCIAEFVERARKNPQSVQPPQAYVQH